MLLKPECFHDFYRNIYRKKDKTVVSSNPKSERNLRMSTETTECSTHYILVHPVIISTVSCLLFVTCSLSITGQGYTICV